MRQCEKLPYIGHKILNLQFCILIIKYITFRRGWTGKDCSHPPQCCDFIEILKNIPVSSWGKPTNLKLPFSIYIHSDQINVNILSLFLHFNVMLS